MPKSLIDVLPLTWAEKNVSLSFYKIMKLFIVLNSRLCAWLGYYWIFIFFGSDSLELICHWWNDENHCIMLSFTWTGLIIVFLWVMLQFCLSDLNTHRFICLSLSSLSNSLCGRWWVFLFPVLFFCLMTPALIYIQNIHHM